MEQDFTRTIPKHQVMDAVLLANPNYMDDCRACPLSLDLSATYRHRYRLTVHWLARSR